MSKLPITTDANKQILHRRLDAYMPAMTAVVVEAIAFEDVVEFSEIASVIQYVVDAAIEHQHRHSVVHSALSTLQHSAGDRKNASPRSSTPPPS